MVVMTNPPDSTTPQEQLVGTNIPEFFASLKIAASTAIGYSWRPVMVFRNEENKREFIAVDKKDVQMFRSTHKKWKRIVTVTPHVFEK